MKSNNNNIIDVIENVKILKNKKKFEEALEILDELYKLHSNSEEIKNILIETLFDYGGYLNDEYTLEYNKAKKIFKRITVLDPNNYRAHYNLGISYFNLNRMERAQNSFEIALKIKPDYKYCLYNIGLIYEEAEMYEQALSYYEKTLDIDPDFSYALAAQAQIKKKLDQLKRMKIN